MNDQIKQAYELALNARKNAHAPYSKFFVGACLKLKNGEFIVGCNMENASFGATTCAERNAFANMVVNHGKQDVEFLVVVTDTDPSVGPCGLCLQVMSEFCEADMPVHLGNLKEIQTTTSFKEIMPQRFTEF